MTNSVDRGQKPAGYRYGGPAFPRGIVLGIGLGTLLDDFWAWLLIAAIGK